MALTGSGTISLSDIRDEFSPGSNTPVSFDDYYRGGTKVRSNAGNNTATNLAANVPTSGAISLNSFYSQARGWQKTFSSNATQQSGSGIFGNDYSVDYPKYIVINSGVTVYSTSTSTPALNLASGGVGSINVTNNGNIYGQGGAAGSNGGTALKADVTTTLVNNSGANIKGGGGGGGTGGTGGKGVYTVNATFSNLVDEGGGGTSTPQNNSPSWFTVYGSSGNNLDGVGVVGDRLWGGIGAQFSRGINPAQFDLNSLGGAGTGLSGNCANRGPIYFSAQTNTTGVYTLTASISSDYGSGYGTPTFSVSESTSSAGTSKSLFGTVGINASTKTYFTFYGTTAHQGTASPNFYYNSLSASVSGTCKFTQAGGSGGSGGVGQGFAQSAGSGSAGGSGITGSDGRSGDGGAGGAGGSLGASGSTGATGSNGSGTFVSFPSTAPTNGVSGSAGGLAGYYIQGDSNVTRTGSGTVAGRTV
jgi:hypothetical protein